MAEPLVSIIIPCMNYAQYVEQAIVSALNQSYKNIEIVAVDDGSTDNSLEVMMKHPIRVVEHPYNKGLPCARNTGISDSGGDLIIALDADDQLHREYVSLCVAGYEQLKEGNKIGIVRTGLIHFDGHGKFEECPPLGFGGMVDELVANRIFVSSMFTRHAWEEVEGYSEDMNDGFEDWEFWIKILEKGYNVLTVQRNLLFYRFHPRSKGKMRSLERTLASKQRLFYKHRDTWRKALVESLPKWKEEAKEIV